ncbi:MAG: hypothetical protein L0Z53_10380, partial [Acidobacteriales bacterium]|nr:hypothetical protein [Terriglobales bacterium]
PLTPMKKPKPSLIADIALIPEEELETAFPGGFTIRDEANALTAYAFRNGPLEDLHAGKTSPLTDDPSLSRITDAEIKNLMINASEHLAKMRALRDSDPEAYRRFLQSYGMRYCKSWNR